MDLEQFDAFAKLIGARTARRTALGALAGAALLGLVPDPLAARGKHKRRRRRKKRKSRKHHPCYTGTSCQPGPGQDNAACDFSRSATLRDRDVTGARLSGANFTLADMRGADLRGADLSGACLTNALLYEAIIDETTNLEGAIFCHTVMPDGSLNDSDCERGTRCCPTTDYGEVSPDGSCINTFNHICSIFGTPCCSHRLPSSGVSSGGCDSPAPIPAIGLCEWACNEDSDCTFIFGMGAKCAPDIFLCPHDIFCCQYPD